MTEKDKPEGQEPTTPEGQEPTGTPETDKTFTAEYVTGIRQEAAGYRVKLKELEAKLSERETAEKEAEQKRLEQQQEWKTLAEKRQAELAEMSAQIEARDAELRKTTIKHAIITEAAKQNASDPDDVYRLIDVTAVTIDESGNVTGHDTAVKSLLEAKPYLTSKQKANGVPQTPAPVGAGEMTPDERRKRAKRTF